jgi:hypothetical protein
MKMKLNVGNSVYQGGYSGGGPGLTVKNGRLVNNAPDGRMGITKMAAMVKEMKREQKVSMQTDAILRAESIEKMNEMMDDMMGGCCD